MQENVPKSSTENTKNTFFAKAIENWLTNTNELGYQMPFCQLLLNEGYRIVHISKHNPFEQGKDIIAVDSDNTPHIYQLKGGNISLSVWRNIVKAEAEELIDLSIIHPSIDKSKPFIPYLVTNGYLEDTVRLQIDNLNEGKWKQNPLRVILLGELLEKFLKWSYEFTPQEISNYKTFLDLYFSDGREFIDEERFARFLESVTRLDKLELPKEERKRNIAAAVLFTGYVATPFKEANNHIALINILVILASHIFAVAEKFSLSEKYWKPSFDLVWEEIVRSADELEQELLDGGFDALYNSLWDGEIAPYRKHVVASYLFAYKFGQSIQGTDKWKSIIENKLFDSLIRSFNVWGESALLGLIFGYLYARKIAAPSDKSPETLLVSSLELLVYFNGRKSSFGLPSPYYNIEKGVTANLGLLDDEDSTEDFVGRSHYLKPIIELLVRADRRDILEKHWRELTYIQMERFIPLEKWMYFLRYSGLGEHVSEFPKQTQSWSELKQLAQNSETNEIPNLLLEHSYFLPLFLLVFPHRVNSQMIQFLDK